MAIPDKKLQFDSELEKTYQVGLVGMLDKFDKLIVKLIDKLNVKIEEQDGLLPGRETNLISDVHMQYSKEHGSAELPVKVRNYNSQQAFICCV